MLELAGVKQSLHLPLLPTKVPMDIMCPFRPRENELAVFIVTKNLTLEQLQEKMPLGATVSHEVFGN